MPVSQVPEVGKVKKKKVTIHVSDTEVIRPTISTRVSFVLKFLQF